MIPIAVALTTISAILSGYWLSDNTYLAVVVVGLTVSLAQWTEAVLWTLRTTSKLRTENDTTQTDCTSHAYSITHSRTLYQSHFKTRTADKELHFKILHTVTLFSSVSVYLIPFKQLHDRIQTQIRTWMEKD